MAVHWTAEQRALEEMTAEDWGIVLTAVNGSKWKAREAFLQAVGSAVQAGEDPERSPNVRSRAQTRDRLFATAARVFHNHRAALISEAEAAEVPETVGAPR